MGDFSMGKELKNKKNKVPVIGEKEYAQYIDFLKNECGTQKLEQGVREIKPIPTQKIES